MVIIEVLIIFEVNNLIDPSFFGFRIVLETGLTYADVFYKEKFIKPPQMMKMMTICLVE